MKQFRALGFEASIKAVDVDLLHQALRDAEKLVALLTDVIEALSQSRDALSLLQRSVESVVRATDASGAFVYLWNEDLGQFVLRVATEGHQKAFVGRIALRPGEGLTGWSALMRRPVLIGRNLSSDPRAVMFPELLEDNFLSCLIVPILVPGGDPVGVFSIYSVVEDAFSDNDLRLVDEVAHLLASGIDRAHVVDLWERQSAALESLIGMAETAPTGVVGILTELVQRATAIVPSEIGIVETLDFDGSVSESAALVTRRPQLGQLVEGTCSQIVITSTKARELAESASPPLQVVNILMRLADRTLGVVTVFRATPYTKADRVLLEAIASYGALALQGSTSPNAEDSTLGQLMTAQSEDAAASILKRCGWTVGTWVTPVVIRCDPELALRSGRPLKSVVHTVESVFSGKWRRVLTTTSGIIAALVISPDKPQAEDLVPSWVVHEIASALENKGQSSGVAIGVGRPSPNASEIAHEFREAAMALNWATVSGDGVRLEIAAQGNLARQMIGISRSLVPAISEHLDLIGRVRDYDHRHSTDLLETLEVFVREHGSVQQASGRLYIHRNTLRQRLNKISTLIDQPVEGIQDWLPVLLAVMILRQE